MVRLATQSRTAWLGLDSGMATVGFVLLITVIILSVTLATDIGDSLTRNTVRLALASYAAALGLMMRLESADWFAISRFGRLARWFWTWAVVCFVVHVAMAFHFYHHWSHADAFARTRAISGNGNGILVSYAFTLLWLADVSWWWIRPQTYARRSSGIDRTLHGFMLFIVFNGMVVFANGAIRWAGLLMFAGLMAIWLATRCIPRPRLA